MDFSQLLVILDPSMLKLEEFSGNRDFEVFVTYRMLQGLLTLEYQIKGPLKQLYPDPLPEEHVPAVGHDLWKKTCFECFFFQETSEHYAELNFNPMGEYALLFFSEYRKPADQAEHFRVTSIRHREASQDLTAIVSLTLPKSVSFLCSPTAILMPVGAAPLYFALHHGTKPDFHARPAIADKAFALLS